MTSIKNIADMTDDEIAKAYVDISGDSDIKGCDRDILRFALDQADVIYVQLMGIMSMPHPMV